MPNITLAIDDKTLRSARDVAHKRGTSLNAMVREHLESLVRQSDEWEAERRRLLAQLKENSRTSGARLPEGYRFDRGEAYEGRPG